MSRRLIFFLLLMIVAAALLLAPLPIPPTSAGRTIENAGHTPLFVLVTLGLLIVLRGDFKIEGVRLYVVAGLIGAAGGAISELLQQPMHRDASWEDVIADCVGVVCALSLFALFDRRTAIDRFVRWLALVVAVACAVVYVSPVVRMTQAYLHRNGEFPVIADFRSGIELYWIVGYGINADIVGDALEVDFSADKFPGVSFHEPVRDWRGYHTLCIDVENPDAAPFDLTVRVHDRRHNQSYVDRFNRNYKLGAGERRTLRISLADIEKAPRGRLLDLAFISDITLFRHSHEGSRHLRIYTIRLE